MLVQKKLCSKLVHEKAACKLLVKLTPGCRWQREMGIRWTNEAFEDKSDKGSRRWGGIGMPSNRFPSEMDGKNNNKIVSYQIILIIIIIYKASYAKFLRFS